MLVILAFTPGSAQPADYDHAILDQGWKRHHTVEGRQELKANVKKWEGQRSASPTAAPERWARRDKKMVSAARRAELDSLAAGEGNDDLDGTSSTPPFGIVLLAFGALLIFLAMKNPQLKQALMSHPLVQCLLAKMGISAWKYQDMDIMDDKAFDSFPAKPRDFSWLNVELIQQALIVMRHTSTRFIERALDVAESATDLMDRSVSRLTTKVRQTRRQMKKEDPDCDLLELKVQCDKMSEEFKANSLVDLDLKVKDIVKPAENLKIGVQWAMDELIQSVNDDSDDEKVGAARPSNLMPIDQL